MWAWGQNFAPAWRHFSHPGFALFCLSRRVRVCKPTWGSAVAIKRWLRRKGPENGRSDSGRWWKVAFSCWPCRLKLTASPKCWINHASHLSCGVPRAVRGSVQSMEMYFVDCSLPAVICIIAAVAFSTCEMQTPMAIVLSLPGFPLLVRYAPLKQFHIASSEKELLSRAAACMSVH